MILKRTLLTIATLMTLIPAAYAFSVVGSSTVFPFASSVAEIVGQTEGSTPTIESTGTGGGFKVFCSGVDLNTPSLTNASRPIKDSELEACIKNGVTPIGFDFGKDSIVIAYSAVNGEDINFTTGDIYRAVAANVPIDGKLVPNPYTTWNQINPTLPDRIINLMGPPQTSGTRDTFLTLAVIPGCKDAIKDLALDEETAKKACEDFRTDGLWVDSGENDNLLVQKLEVNPDSFAVFGFYYLENNVAEIKAASINDVYPTYETAIDGSYVLTRDLYIYVKKEHIGKVSGIPEYLTEFLSEVASGEEGYLETAGLIVNPIEKRDEQRNNLTELLNSIK